MQKLILPINNTVFTAGYKNALYLKQYGFNHFGVDMYDGNGTQTVYACGDGEVLLCGMDGPTYYSKMGNVIIILYKDVQLHDGTVKDLVCQMFHFAEIKVKKGQKVTKDTVIGIAGNSGGTTLNGQRMGIHLHAQFDTDTEYPKFVSGATGGGKIVQRGLIDSTVNPSDIWNIDYNQQISGKYEGWYTSADIDLPHVDTRKPSEPDKEPENNEQSTPSNFVKISELIKAGYKGIEFDV